MSESRSKRSRTQVDYSKFGQDADDDDDFADATPPPGKKPKKSAPQKKSTLQTALEKQAASKKLPRKPVTERSFDRDLEMALALSRQEAGVGPEDSGAVAVSSSQDSDCGPGGVSMIVTAEVEGKVVSSSLVQGEASKMKKSARKTQQQQHQDKREDPDFIEFLGQDEVLIEDKAGSGRRRRHAAAKAAKYWSPSEDEDEEETGISGKAASHTKNKDDDDTDFRGSHPSSWDSPSDSEESWAGSDGDSDFDGCKSKKSKKKTIRDPPKAAAKSKTTNKTKQKAAEDSVYMDGIKISQPFAQKTSTPISKPITSANKTQHKPAKIVQKENSAIPTVSGNSVKSPIISTIASKKSLGAAISKKSSPMVSSDAPRRSLGSCGSMRSPTGGGLRLGLSKKARIKPLHTSVNMPH